MREKLNCNIDQQLFRGESSIKYEKALEYRHVLSKIIEAVKYIGKQGLAFRGKKYESAYTLDDESVNHGNFLELMLLIAESDAQLKLHIENCISKSKKNERKS